MKNIIANKEYIALLRDKRFKIMGGLIAFLLLIALLGGFASYRSLKKERDLAQKEASETWPIKAKKIRIRLPITVRLRSDLNQN